jgi:hypothetical protein
MDEEDQRIGIINALFLGRSCSKRAGKRGRGMGVSRTPQA